MKAGLSRRGILGAGAALATASVTGVAQSRVLPRDMTPLIGRGYRAVDEDEKGMWQMMERVEEEVSGSNLLIRDPALTSYLGDLIGHVGGPAATDMRIVISANALGLLALGLFPGGLLDLCARVLGG